MSLIGVPTAAAVPVTPELLHSYKAWLRAEHLMLCHELTGYHPAKAQDLHGVFYSDHPGFDWHYR